MDGTNALSRLADQPALDVVGKPLSDAVKGLYESAGAAGQKAKDALHGVWLGHPLHPVLTDLPIGAWTTALVLDAVAATTRERGMARAADVAIGVGLAGAVGAAVTGLTDWAETDGRSRRTGLLHGLMNLSATMLYAASYLLRRNGARSAGQTCAVAGYGVAIGAAYFGGNLVYDQRVGVMHATVEAPEAFTAVARSAQLAENSMMRARKDDLDLVVARQHGRVCALAHACAHLGGPLSEGTLKEGTVVCPWHGSEFTLDEGHVVRGPATHDQPCLEARERDGDIEVKGPGNA